MRTYIKDYILLTIGALIYAFAIEAFFVPSHIIDGGITGISMIINKLTDKPLGLFIVAINLPFVILALQKLGKRFVFSTFYAIIIFALGVTWFSGVFHGQCIIPDLELFLASIFGGVILGAGVGLVIRNGASLDGTEIMSLVLSKKFGFSVGEWIMTFNIFIYGAAGFVFGWNKAMYAILTYFIAFKVIDIVIEGLNTSKSIRIISDKSYEIGQELLEKLDIGVTYIKGTGAYSGAEKTIIYCVISRLEMAKMKEIIKEIDSSAFISVVDVHEAYGGRTRKTRHKIDKI